MNVASVHKSDLHSWPTWKCVQYIFPNLRYFWPISLSSPPTSFRSQGNGISFPQRNKPDDVSGLLSSGETTWADGLNQGMKRMGYVFYQTVLFLHCLFVGLFRCWVGSRVCFEWNVLKVHFYFIWLGIISNFCRLNTSVFHVCRSLRFCHLWRSWVTDYHVILNDIVLRCFIFAPSPCRHNPSVMQLCHLLNRNCSLLFISLVLPVESWTNKSQCHSG